MATMLQSVKKFLSEGVESASKNEKGEITKIGDWTPNNLKTLIITKDRLILEHHVAPLGRMTQKVWTEKIECESLELQGDKGLLQLLAGGKDRAYSNIEEILITEDAIKTPLNIGLLEKQTDMLKEKYTRFYALSILKSLKSDMLYKDMKQRADKLGDYHWVDVYKKKGLILKQINLNTKDWVLNYTLRPRYYVLDKTPKENKNNISKAQLYNYFETKASGYREIQEKQQQIQEKQEVARENLLSICTEEWIIKGLDNKDVYIMENLLHTKDISAPMRYGVLSEMIQYNKDEVIVDILDILTHKNIEVLLPRQQYKRIYPLIKALRMGLYETLVGDKKANCEKVQEWLFYGGKEDTKIGVRDLTEDDISKIAQVKGIDKKIKDILKHYLKVEYGYQIARLHWYADNVKGISKENIDITIKNQLNDKIEFRFVTPFIKQIATKVYNCNTRYAEWGYQTCTEKIVQDNPELLIQNYKSLVQMLLKYYNKGMDFTEVQYTEDLEKAKLEFNLAVNEYLKEIDWELIDYIRKINREFWRLKETKEAELLWYQTNRNYIGLMCDYFATKETVKVLKKYDKYKDITVEDIKDKEIFGGILREIFNELRYKHPDLNYGAGFGVMLSTEVIHIGDTTPTLPQVVEYLQGKDIQYKPIVTDEELLESYRGLKNIMPFIAKVLAYYIELEDSYCLYNAVKYLRVTDWHVEELHRTKIRELLQKKQIKYSMATVKEVHRYIDERGFLELHTCFRWLKGGRNSNLLTLIPEEEMTISVRKQNIKELHEVLSDLLMIKIDVE